MSGTMGTVRCSECKRRRETYPARRFGGGDYRRPGRWYATSVCADCAREAIGLVDRTVAEGRTPGSKVWGLSVNSLRKVLERLDAVPADSSDEDEERQCSNEYGHYEHRWGLLDQFHCQGL